jgi:predicted esterase
MIIEKTTEQRTQLYYDLYVPDDTPPTPKPLVIALHGYEGNKESMMSLMRKVNERDFIIASVQGPNGFFVRTDDERQPKIGFGWMMQFKTEETVRLHHQTLLSVIETTAAEHAVNRRAIFLVAFSQSVSLNYRFAFTHPNLARGVIGVCGGIPGDWDSSDKYQPSDTDALIIAGETDPFYPINRVRTFEESIARRARSVTFQSYDIGHVFPRESLPFINQWILERAKAEG